MSDSDDTERSGARAPRFDGTTEKWRYFKKQMESHLARLGLGELLVETTGGTILKDTDTTTGTDDEKKEKERLRKANRKAAGILLNSISIDTKDGQADFQLIEKWHNAKDGYVGGHFYRIFGHASEEAMGNSQALWMEADGKTRGL